MKAEERRTHILKYFENQKGPISASALAKVFSVSRQIIVGDVALLRASGVNITATPRGYVLTDMEQKGLLRQIVCSHSQKQMERELQICVDHGCSVLDVSVEHPIYGQLTCDLQLHSRYDVDQFLQKIHQEDAHSLSELTDGIHIHTLCCPSEEVFLRVYELMKQEGIMLGE